MWSRVTVGRKMSHECKLGVIWHECGHHGLNANISEALSSICHTQGLFLSVLGPWSVKEEFLMFWYVAAFSLKATSHRESSSWHLASVWSPLSSSFDWKTSQSSLPEMSFYRSGSPKGKNQPECREECPARILKLKTQKTFVSSLSFGLSAKCFERWFLRVIGGILSDGHRSHARTQDSRHGSRKLEVWPRGQDFSLGFQIEKVTERELWVQTSSLIFGGGWQLFILSIIVWSRKSIFTETGMRPTYLDSSFFLRPPLCLSQSVLKTWPKESWPGARALINSVWKHSVCHTKEILSLKRYTDETSLLAAFTSPGPPTSRQNWWHFELQLW